MLCCSVIDLSGPCADVSSRGDEVSVIKERDEYVVWVERSEVSCCDSVRGWSNARALYGTGRDTSRARDVSIKHGRLWCELPLKKSTSQL